MRTINLTYPHKLLKENLPETVCAIGFFDGIHKGHLEVIKTAVKTAQERKIESAVITFHPHPTVVLRSDVDEIKYITPLGEKKEIIRKLNVDRLYVITFNEQLSKLSPKEFIEHFLINLHIKHVVAGFDYSYGHKGQGNMEMMESLSNGQLTTTVINKVESENEKVSSTKIRSLLKDGNVEEVNQLLKRPLELTGKVVEGEKRGRILGFPTANLEISEDALVPKVGVYAVKVHIKDVTYYGMTNLGYAPTFSDKKEPTVEVNIFDYNDDIYGEELRIEWHSYIRDEKKFNKVEDLVAQLHADETLIRNYFNKQK